MRLLGIETSSERGSLCLIEFEEKKILTCHEVAWQKLGSHSEVIIDQLSQALAFLKWTASDLTHLAVGVGPGSFTGIRVGMSLAKSLGYGLALPLAGLCSLEILASPFRRQGLPVLVLMNAFRNQLYCATYQNGNVVQAPCLLTIQEVERLVNQPYVGCGDGFELHRTSWSATFLKNITHFPSNESLPASKDLCLRLAANFRPGDFESWRNIKPLYVRASSAEEKLKDGALKPQKVF